MNKKTNKPLPFSRQRHNIAPVFDKNSEVLILGSFPSVKSRETGFFYGHPQNRFWKVTAAVFGDDVPDTVPEKKAFLLRHKTALWDVIASCDISGSADARIKDPVPNDISPLIENSRITRIFTNGATAARLYEKLIFPTVGIAAERLPSTSPANAAFGMERLIAAWSVIKT